jgi:cell division transport system permease protein
MYNRKLEISIMKAVGATDSFVRIPFVVEGVSIGIISALLSLGVLYCCYRVAVEAILSAIGSYTLIPFSSQVWLLLGVFVAIGVVAGSLGSIIMIGKYLKREGSEFAAI